MWELDWLMANALAFPLGNLLVFSTVLVEQFTGAEIEAIAHHEVGHLRESWPTKLMRPLALVVVMGLVLAAPELMTGGTLALAAAVAGLLIVIVVVRRVGRHAETAADAHAHDSHD